MLRRRGGDRARLPARSNLTSYYRGQPASQSPFQKKEPRTGLRSKVSKVVDILIVLIVAFCFIYSLIVSPPPKIISSSNLYEPNYIYQKAAAQKMDGFSFHNKLTFDESALISSMQKEFPEIDNASVELPLFGQKPVVRLSIAKPDFVLSSGGVRYILASNGVIVARADMFAADDSLPVLTDASGYQAQIGKPVLSADQTSFVTTVLSQLKKAAVPVASLTLPPKTAEEMDLRTKDQRYFTKFYLDGDPLVEAGQYLAARHQFASDSKQPSKYLDVRVAGKIFYK
ncbi:MAG TPA: hypothetical protein VG964_01275 [Candidatus Saccharimonadales bacterium]|nr:hypothetical protein [Candidatus Saccharimonadales bacterium]